MALLLRECTYGIYAHLCRAVCRHDLVLGGIERIQCTVTLLSRTVETTSSLQGGGGLVAHGKSSLDGRGMEAA